MANIGRKLKSILTKAGKIASQDCDALLAQAVTEKKLFSELLIAKKVVSEPELLALIAKSANLAPIDLEKVKVNQEVLQTLPVEVARDYGVLPVEKIGNILTLAVSNPFDVLKFDDIRIITGCELRPMVAAESAISAAIQRCYRTIEEEMDEILADFSGDEVELKEDASEDDAIDLGIIANEASPVVKMVNKIISDAVSMGVSDIHVEPFEKRVLVRYRKDGVLQEVMQPPKKLQNGVTSRIKIMAKLDIAEKRKPQDGKFQMKLGNKAIDF